MVIALTIMLTVITLLLLASIAHIRNMQKEITLLNKVQYQQTKEIGDLIKNKLQHQEILLQHIDILKYLIDQDPMLGNVKYPYGGTVGEA